MNLNTLNKSRLGKMTIMIINDIDGGNTEVDHDDNDDDDDNAEDNGDDTNEDDEDVDGGFWLRVPRVRRRWGKMVTKCEWPKGRRW